MNCYELDRPFVELGERVAMLSPPFASLRDVVAGFAPFQRFILNEVLLGSEDAAIARGAIIGRERYRRLRAEPAAPCADVIETYYRANLKRILAFREENYPWLHFDSYDGAPTDFEVEPNLDRIIDQAVFDNLSELKFDTKRRKARPTYWSATSGLTSVPVVLRFDKGSRGSTSMSAHLEFKNVPFSIDLADPFFFSQAEFTFSVGRDVERQLNDFMKELTRVLPDVVAALVTVAGHLEKCDEHR